MSNNNIDIQYFPVQERSKQVFIEDYCDLLSSYDLTFIMDDYYIHVGTPKISQGWLLHISVIHTQIKSMLEAVVPQLKKISVPFKIIKTKTNQYYLNMGLFGEFQIGKMLTIYPKSPDEALSIAETLLPKLNHFKGPIIPSDIHLGNVLYARYGTFIPNIDVDGIGKKERLILNGMGEIEKDIYTAPARIPKGISNPFENILATIPVTEDKKVINGKYLFIKLLYTSFTGKIYKVLCIKNGIIRFRVIKQGMNYTKTDDFGRDCRDRLLWQYQLHNRFHKVIPLAKVHDFFDELDSSFLVMDFIKGKNLAKHIVDLYSKQIWPNLSKTVKSEIIMYLEQIAGIVAKMHEHEIVHRDITATNFIISKYHKVHLLDLELAYDLKHKSPSPPFQFGTNGYVSPEQYNMAEPEKPTDIYALGCVMILLFTGMESLYIVEPDLKRVKAKLNLLIKDKSIVTLILSCIQFAPSSRPNVSSIQESIIHIKNDLNNNGSPTQIMNFHSRTQIAEIIQDSLDSFADATRHHNLLWLSESFNGYNVELNYKGNKDVYIGMNKGLSGIIYLLFRARILGFQTQKLQVLADKAREYLFGQLNQHCEKLPLGLHFGTAGLALALVPPMDDNNFAEQVDLLLKCFQRETPIFNLIHGISGQGLSLLQIHKKILDDRIRIMLTTYVNKILDKQDKDGSWPIQTLEHKSEHVYNFGYGMAGILYFLLEYYKHFHEDSVLLAARKGFDYLVHRSIGKKGTYTWNISDKNKTPGKWWCDGTPGIALSFLKAYEITNDYSYLQIAESCLRFHPREILNKNLSQCHGIAGLGELYLEAYSLSQNEEWLLRSTWIAELLIRLRNTSNLSTSYWLVENIEYPTADLLVGEGGIIHFLLRFISPGKLSYPLLY